jgi:hypothetical protein
VITCDGLLVKDTLVVWLTVKEGIAPLGEVKVLTDVELLVTGTEFVVGTE